MASTVKFSNESKHFFPKAAWQQNEAESKRRHKLLKKKTKNGFFGITKNCTGGLLWRPMTMDNESSSVLSTQNKEDAAREYE